MLLFLASFPASPAGALSPGRFADVVQVEGGALAALYGVPIERLGLLACRSGVCEPIPFQVDERSPDGQWALDQGPFPRFDEPPQVLDENDVLLFMAADAGDSAEVSRIPGQADAVGIRLLDPVEGTEGWVYLSSFPDAAPRSPTTYVQYEPPTDVIRGARVELGFQEGVPAYLAPLPALGGGNLLAGFHVQARATFLFGLVRFSRDERDLTTEFLAWRAGPIRVIRSQRQWVRLGWGIRSPTFGSNTYFYRDFAELPVALHLNFPPTYFFGNIVIRVILAFRDLRGWSLLVPGQAPPIRIDGSMSAEKEALNDLATTWFALLGPDLTLVQTMQLGASLQSVRHRFFYREGEPLRSGDVPGAVPALGFQLERWDEVGAGSHTLAAVSYALPSDLDPRTFLAVRERPLAVFVNAVPR